MSTSSGVSAPSSSRSPPPHPPTSWVVEALSGATAGIVSTLAVHPLDVVKTRLQVDPRASHPGASVRILSSLLRPTPTSPLTLRPLYRGIAPNALGSTISWSLYFLFYSSLKTLLPTLYPAPHPSLTPTDYLLASTTAGILTATLTNPIWVLKTRFLSTDRSAPGAYTSLAHGVRSILAEPRGWRGFYRGLLPSLLGVSHGGVQFVAYEELKNWRRRGSQQGELGNADYLALSAVAKTVAGTATYPYQVVRSRLQNYEGREGSYTRLETETGGRGRVREVVRGIWGREGWRGFYKGLGPNLVRVLPSACVTFVVYENARSYLPGVLGTGTGV